MGTRIEQLEKKSLIAQKKDRFDSKQEVSINQPFYAQIVWTYGIMSDIPGKWVAFKRFVTTMASKY